MYILARVYVLYVLGAEISILQLNTTLLLLYSAKYLEFNLCLYEFAKHINILCTSASYFFFSSFVSLTLYYITFVPNWFLCVNEYN